MARDFETQIPDEIMGSVQQPVRQTRPDFVSDTADKRWALIQAAEEAGEEFFMAAGRVFGTALG